MDRLRVDLMHTWRTIRARPGATLATILVLTLGIGLVTAMFALADPFLLRPLPYPEPDRLVVITLVVPKPAPGVRGFTLDETDVPRLADWQARSDLFEAVAAYRMGEVERLRLAGRAMALQTVEVSGTFFRLMGLPMPSVSASRAGDLGVTSAVLTSAACQRAGLEPASASGRVLDRFDGRAVHVVGVIAPSFLFPRNVVAPRIDALVPIEFDRLVDLSRSITVIARRRPDVSAEAIQTALTQSLRDATSLQVRARSLSTYMTRQVRPIALCALLAGILILLVCAGNVSNLLLCRSVFRQREFASRQALGATRIDLARLILLELGALTAGGVAGGLLAAKFALTAASLVIPTEYAALGEPAVTLRVIVFASVTGAVVMLAGVVPAWAGWRLSPAELLGRQAVGESRRLRAVRFGTAAGQTALAMILVVGAALLGRSYVNLVSQQTGFSGDVLVVSVSYPPDHTGVPLRTDIDATVVALQHVPGVQRAAAGIGPMADGSLLFTAGLGIRATDKRVTADYLRAVGATIVAGRGFSARDTHNSGVVVNESYARRRFPDREAVGQLLSLSVPVPVIGVVRDTFDVALDSPPDPTVFFLMSDRAYGFGTQNRVDFLLRAGRTEDVAAGAARAVARVNPDALVADVSTIQERLGGSIRHRSFATLVMAFFAVAGVGVCTAGLAGIVAFVVARRTREVAIRVAIGATPGRVLGLVLKESLAAAACGVLVGLLAGRWLSTALEGLPYGMGAGVTIGSSGLVQGGLLYGVRAGDWPTLLSAGCVVFAVTVVATAVPAARALRLSPTDALRVE